MTTTVVVQAHCASDKEVVINCKDYVTGSDILEPVVIQDGQEHRQVVFDNRVLTVTERVKE